MAWTDPNNALRTVRKKFNLGRPLTTAETDELIMEMLDLLEEATEELAGCALAAARAEVAYRSAHAREYILCGHRTGEMRERHAVNETKVLLEARREAEAREVAASELCRTRRAQLEALRTLASSARAAEHGRG